jgi:hypothetical protein
MYPVQFTLSNNHTRTNYLDIVYVDFICGYCISGDCMYQLARAVVLYHYYIHSISTVLLKAG